MELRQIFGNEIERLMESDERIMVVDADLGKANGTMNLRKKFPDRAIDVGVAEQNMASVAAGLSSYGFIPFITSFTPFVTRRICDQIAISICYAKQNVKIVGTDPGITAELNGGTHMSVEDIGVLRSIPNIIIFEPADGRQLEQSIEQIVNHDGPVYIRLFRKEVADVYDSNYKFDLFKADVIKEGTDATIIAMGNLMLSESLLAAEELLKEGINVEVINSHTVKPLDVKTIGESLKKTKKVLTCENHNIIGGLYSAVCENFASSGVKINCVGINDEFGQVGKLPELKEYYGLNAKNIAAKVRQLMED